MNKSLWSKILALALSLVLVLSLVPAWGEEATALTDPTDLPEGYLPANGKLLPMETTFYLLSSSLTFSMNLAYVEGNPDIPYISLTDGVDFLNSLPMIFEVFGGTLNPQNFVLVMEDGEALITRDNGCTVVFDTESQSLFISDLNAMDVHCTVPGDVISIAGSGENFTYVQRQDSENQVVSGYAMVASLWENYGIRIYEQDGEIYIPLGLLNDLWLSDGLFLIYNGEAVFLFNDSPEETLVDENGLTMADLYYGVEPGDRSEHLARYNYGELCLLLDFYYGLKDIHGISSFDAYFQMVGLKEALLDQDAVVFDYALAKFIHSYLDDVHSTYVCNSPYAGLDFMDAWLYESVNHCARFEILNHGTKLRSLRDSAPSGVSENGEVKAFYAEVGNTAYLTFDGFVTSNTDYYAMRDENGDLDLEQVKEHIGEDNLALVIYANAMIRREGSPIENVVIDLSCNGGGEVDAGVYLVSWVLGRARFTTQYYATEAKYSFVYCADVDLDGKITEKDTIKDDFTVYCLISPYSFSCGTLVPSLFKSSGNVTLIGRTSGGGAAVVRYANTVDGTQFRISGTNAMCVVKNGSYYSVDQGVEPDLFIQNMEKLYDREWLTEYINHLD